MSKYAIRSFRELQVYRLAFQYSVEVYDLVQAFPQDSDRFLARKLLARSRGVRAHIAAAWGKRRDRMALVASLSAAQLEVAEVLMWLEAAIRSGYLEGEVGQALGDRYRYLSAALDQMMASAALGAKRIETAEPHTLPATA